MPIFEVMKNSKIVRSILLIVLFIVAVNTVQTYVLHITRKFGDIDFYQISVHVFGLIACALSLGSTLLGWKIADIWSLEKISKIVIAFLVSVLIYAVAQSLFYVVERFVIYGIGTNLDMLVGNFVFSTVIFHLYISGLTLAYLAFRENARTAASLQNVEKEKELLQYKMLKKNLEPHFLFNNLSLLSGLVRHKPAEVEAFVDDFSDVYRYYLDHSKEELVSLQQEIAFLEKYVSLMKKRFGNAYIVHIELSDQSGFILPCSLQLAVENAVKHNRASTENPLFITISRTANAVMIVNDLRPVDFTQSSKLGNEFLQKSYELNFGKQVNFIKSETEYTVKIPLIL